jgi:hypothetical protein
MNDDAAAVGVALAREGIVAPDDDLPVIATIVAANRAGLAAARAAVTEEPEVAHGFLPPPWLFGDGGGPGPR